MTTITAVSPSVVTPGLYLSVDLTAGTASPNVGVLRVLVLAPKSASGDLTANTEIRAVNSADEAGTAFGIGTPGHLACVQILDKYPAAQIEAAAPTAGTGTATLSVTAANTPTADNVINCDIMGREFEVAWLSGESPTQIQVKLTAAIVARTSDLACTSVAGGAGVCIINSKVAGGVGKDILVKMKLRGAGTGETLTGAVTHTALTVATTEPDFTTILAAAAGKEYHFIVPCVSNTDAANTATSNNIDKVYGHINTYNSGLDAKLQTFLCGFTGSLASAIASTPHANSCNDAKFGEFLLCITGRSLPAEFAGRECGGWLAALSLDPAANRIGEQLDGVYGSYNVLADRPTLAESESALSTGVALVTYNSGDAEVLARPVTTHSSTNRLRDCQNVHATYIVARDLRDNLPLEFPNAKIQPDGEPGAEPPPPGVIEEKDIKAFCISRLRAWERQGVITKASLDAAIADGSLLVQVNGTDPTQVDIVLPFKIVQPLAKMGLVVQRQPS